MIAAATLGALFVFHSASTHPWNGLLDSFITVQIGRDHDDDDDGKHHHDSRQHNDGDGDKKHSTKIIIIDKHSSSNTNYKKDVNKNDETNKKQKDTLFGERAGEIHGFINVDKTCTEAYHTPSFGNFSTWFHTLVGVPATQLSKHMYSFQLSGFSSVQHVKYNETAMTLNVVIVDGFFVFQAFHEVFAFVKHHGKCRIYRTQYLILAEDGPVTWSDMQAAGNEELTAMYKLLGP